MHGGKQDLTTMDYTIITLPSLRSHGNVIDPNYPVNLDLKKAHYITISKQILTGVMPKIMEELERPESHAVKK
jgi:hypothetical protein